VFKKSPVRNFPNNASRCIRPLSQNESLCSKPHCLPDQSLIPHHDPAEGWERLQLTRLRVLVEDQEAGLREKDFQLNMLYQEERLKHSTTREALEHKNALVWCSVDATEASKELSVLSFAVEELKLHQQAIL
jgi:hypothetical protein